MSFISLLALFFLFRIIYRWFFDSSDKDTPLGQGNSQDTRYTNRLDVFKEALLTVIAATMRADGSVSRTELNVVKKVLVNQFGVIEAQTLLLRLRDILKTDIDVVFASRNIARTVSYNDRVTIANILCDIVEADGIITASEVQAVVNICFYMGLTQYDTQRIASRLHVNGNERGNSNGGYSSTYGGGGSSLTKSYETLGINKDATNEELKNAYRSLVKKYHPDRYASQGEAAQAEAEKKFKEIQTAYEDIKAARGL